MKKLIPWVLALSAAPAMSANFFDNLANDVAGGDRQKQLRADYYDATKNGQRHSLDSIRHFKMKEDFEAQGAEFILAKAYYKFVLPYFYEGNDWSEDFVWTDQMVEVVKAQRGFCMTKKNEAAKDQAELKVSYATAPMGQSGQRVTPHTQINRYRTALQALNIACKGVDPGSFMNGNQVWLSMEKNVKSPLGNIKDEE